MVSRELPLKLRITNLTTLSLLGSILLCGGLLWASYKPANPPDNWLNPSLYPGAQNVKVQDFGGKYQDVPERPNFKLVKVITFITANKIKDVDAFYDTRYPQVWTSGACERPTQAPGTLHCEWANGGRPSTGYDIDIVTKVSASGGTDIEIKISIGGGY